MYQQDYKTGLYHMLLDTCSAIWTTIQNIEKSIFQQDRIEVAHTPHKTFWRGQRTLMPMAKSKLIEGHEMLGR